MDNQGGTDFEELYAMECDDDGIEIECFRMTTTKK